MNMSIDEIKDICVQIAINGVHISQKIKSLHDDGISVSPNR